MPQNGTVDINETLAAWADIVIKIWHEKITELRVYDKGTLDQSLLNELVRNAGSDIDKIDFSFKLYGQFVDMGVGREFSKGNSGNIDSSSRQPKEWYSRKFFGQVMKLREILLEKYSLSISYNILNTLNADFDQRFTSNLYSKTVNSLRTVTYRKQQSSRNARNYARRRSMGGHWAGNKTWTPD